MNDSGQAAVCSFSADAACLPATLYLAYGLRWNSLARDLRLDRLIGRLEPPCVEERPGAIELAP